MPPGILSSLISAGGNLLGSLFGFGSQQSTNAANMEIAKYQYEKNLEMWNRNNAYNSPQAQMQRLKNAGLNPNLVYGNGAVGNASSTPPQFEAPTMQAYTNFGDLGASAGVDAYMRSRMVDADIRNRDADTFNKGLQGLELQYNIDTQWLRTYRSLAELDIALSEGKEKRIKLDSLKDMLNMTLSEMEARRDNYRSMIDYRNNYEAPLSVANKENIEANTAFTKGPRTVQAYASANASNASANASNAMADSIRWKTNEDKQTFNQRFENIKQQYRINESTHAKILTEVRKLASEIKLNKVKYTGEDLQNEIKRFVRKYKLPADVAGAYVGMATDIAGAAVKIP